MNNPKDNVFYTKCGYKVIGIEFKPLNDAGEKVTYPIKGTMLIPRNNGRFKKQFNTWQGNGRISIFDTSPLDLNLDC